jgi:hypothetical protein
MAEAGDDEPRFAGSAPAGYVARAPGPSPWASESAAPIGYAQPIAPQPPFSMPDTPPPVGPPPNVSEPKVNYRTGEPPAETTSIPVDVRGGIALLVAAAGGVLAVVSSQLTWATLELSGGGELPADSGSNIDYSGSSLIEGRLMLGVGVLAVVFSLLVLLRRPLELAVWVTGAAGLAITAFAAISHPVDLATLLRSNAEVGDVTVNTPNGSGVWLALAGAALILIGGLMAHFLRSFRAQRDPVPEPATDIAPVPEV